MAGEPSAFMLWEVLIVFVVLLGKSFHPGDRTFVPNWEFCRFDHLYLDSRQREVPGQAKP